MISVLGPLFVLTITSAALTAAMVFWRDRFLPGQELPDTEKQNTENPSKPTPAVEIPKLPARAISFKNILGGVWWMMFGLVLIFFFPWAVAMGSDALGRSSLWCVGLLMVALAASALYIRGRRGFVSNESLPTD